MKNSHMCNAYFFWVERRYSNKTVVFESLCPSTINLTVMYKGKRTRDFHCLFRITIVLVENLRTVGSKSLMNWDLISGTYEQSWQGIGQRVLI